MVLDPEILAGEGLAELPIGGGDVPGGGGAVVAGGDPEGEGLAHQDHVRLPILAPIPAHGHPSSAGPLYADSDDVPSTCYIGH